MSGEIRDENGKILLENHQVRFSTEQTKLITQLERVFSRSPFLTPSVQECIEMVGNDVFKAMVSKDLIIEVSPGIVFMKTDIDQIISMTKAFLEENQKISASEFRDQFKTSRKYAIALLEYMDKNGITERINDYRVLKKS